MNEQLLNDLTNPHRVTQTVTPKRQSVTAHKTVWFYAGIGLYFLVVLAAGLLIVSQIPKIRAQNIPWYVAASSDPAWSFVEMSDLHAGLNGFSLDNEFSNTISLLISNKTAWNIKLFISAGDLYEHNTYSFYTNQPYGFCGATLTNQLWNLKRAGISVMAVQGNHDSDSGTF